MSSAFEIAAMESSSHASNAFNSRLYLPLAESDEIRLLSLQPGHTNKTIKCTLQHTKLTSSPIYEALSYMWGPKEYRTIELDGKPYAVTENLWQALIHLRLEAEPRTMWVDAICINQEDVSERNQQVMQMGAIYSRASIVLVWLGLPDATTQLAFEVFKSSLRGPDRYLDNVKLFFPGDQLKAIEALCSREYWSRLWIVQEVLLAHKIILCCGNLQLNWLYFQFALTNMVSPDQSPPRFWTDMWASTPYFICMFEKDRFQKSGHSHPDHDAYRDETTNPLGYLCSIFARGKCQEVKDRVFGLSGIAEKCCKNNLTIDYSIQWPVICTTVLHHYITAHRTVESGGILWTAQRFHTMLQVRSEDYIQLDNKFYGSDCWNFGPDSRTLKATGTVRGEITCVFPFTDRSKRALSVTSPSLEEELCSSLPAGLPDQICDYKARIEESRYNLKNLEPPYSPIYDLDLVANFPGPLCEVSLHPTEYGDFLKDAIKHTPRMDPKPDETILSQLCDDLGFYRTGSPSPIVEAFSLAVLTDGSSSFVPSQARVGDVLVELKGSGDDIIALVRFSPSLQEENGSEAKEDPGMEGSKDGRIGRLLGRCVDGFYHNEPREPSHQPRGASLLLDLRTLQLLTGASVRDCRA